MAPTKEITSKELDLAARLLRLASQLFSNRNCNDIDDEIWRGWSKEERNELAREWAELNEFPEDSGIDGDSITDWELIELMAEKLNPKE